jgi:Domain of unknown function (DUF1905)/Bacteriocin-protection, YdeI or OmpD-Associated
MGKIQFTGQLTAEGPNGAWTFLEVPRSASEKLGSRGRVSVVGSINGFAIRTSVHPTGTGTHQLAVNKAMQAGADAKAGERVKVVLEVDTQARVVKVPADVTRAINAKPPVKALWATLTPRCREEWVQWIEEAKKPETRLRRIDVTVKRLAEGKRRVKD